jgi:hypothetical protein
VGHGPATERDLAKWSGLGLREVRAGLAGIAGELVAVSGPEDGLVDLAARAGGPAPPPLPPPRLLGAFEPLLMGWTSRAPVLGDHGSLVTTNGIFRPFVFAGGRTIGTWRAPRGGVELELFEEPSTRTRTALAREAADVERFLGVALDGQ